jgi:hypothetical protein
VHGERMTFSGLRDLKSAEISSTGDDGDHTARDE